MSNRRISKNSQFKEGEYNLVKGPFPYHAREDKTTLPPSFLVSPSQNVVNNTAKRLQLVKGYVPDGTVSTAIDSGILANYDFHPTKSFDDVRNMRAGFLTNAGNDGKLQFRYVDSFGTVSWIDLKTSLTTLDICFDGNYFDLTEALRLLLWVDGSNNVFEWNGAVTTYASSTANTITKQGTTSWKDEGFYTTRDKKIVIGGTTYTYTGGETTTTLTGITPDPTGAGYAVGAEVHQLPVTTALTSITGVPATFGPTVIGSGRQNQIYLGSSKSNALYISKRDNFKNFSFSSPVRLIGDGALIAMDAPPVKFIAQEVHGNETAYDMWISTGEDRWAVIRSIVSSDNTSEILDFIRLKSASLQGALSERLVGKMKNHIIFIGHDKVCNAMGYISYQFVPVMEDLSYPIIDDMNSYDFTDGSIFYHKNYLYVAIPKHGLIRIYNMTDQTEQNNPSYYNPTEQLEEKQPFFWEAPVTYPIAGFYVVNGELYGHGYGTSTSYKLFTSGSFNGQDIDANATMAFGDLGDRTSSKSSNEIWIEGYIQQNTKLNCAINEDLDSFQISQSVVVDGADRTIVAYGSGAHSIGKDPLGSRSLGGTLTSTTTLPAWFHVAKTYTQNPYYLEQLSFTSKGVDLDWQLLTFGTNAKFTTEGNNNITQ